MHSQAPSGLAAAKTGVERVRDGCDRAGRQLDPRVAPSVGANGISRAVHGAVVDHNDLEFGSLLSQDGVQAGFDAVDLVARE